MPQSRKWPNTHSIWCMCLLTADYSNVWGCLSTCVYLSRYYFILKFQRAEDIPTAWQTITDPKGESDAMNARVYMFSFIIRVLAWHIMNERVGRLQANENWINKQGMQLDAVFLGPSHSSSLSLAVSCVNGVSSDVARTNIHKVASAQSSDHFSEKIVFFLE